MSSFKFKNSGVKVDIEGWKYTVSFSKITPDFMGKLGEEMVEESKKNLSSEEEIRYIDSKIDSLLGPGSSERIFKDREPSGFERVAVLEFIMNEITKYYNKVKAKK